MAYQQNHRLLDEALENSFYIEMSDNTESTLRHYVLNTSFHGFRYTADSNNHWTERIFWAICCTLSWIATGLLIQSALDDFQNNAISFVVETSYLDWNTSFPAVAVCQIDNQEKIAQLTDRTFGDPHDYNLDEIVKEQIFYHGLSFYTLQLCGPDQWRMHYKGYSNGSDSLEADQTVNENCFKQNFTDFASEIRSSCKDMITDCRWNNKSFDCCEHFKKLDTEMGLCYALGSTQVQESEKPKFEMISNKYTGPGSMRLEIDGYANVYILGEHEVPSLTTAATEVIQAMPRVYYRRRMSTVEIENQPEVRDVSVAQRKCRFADESNLDVYRHYSYSACCVQCKKDAQMRTCGCTHHLMPNTVPQKHCNIDGLDCLSKHDADLAVLKAPWANRTGLVCDCMPGCTEIELAVIKDDKLGIPDDFAVVELTLERLPSERFKRTVVRGRLDLVVSMGGATALFLGASILSFVEVVYYFLVRPFSNQIMARKTKSFCNGGTRKQPRNLKSFTL